MDNGEPCKEYIEDKKRKLRMRMKTCCKCSSRSADFYRSPFSNYYSRIICYNCGNMTSVQVSSRGKCFEKEKYELIDIWNSEQIYE